MRVLEKFMSIPNLFRTEEFKSKFQPIARDNIRRELESLKA